MCVCGRCMSNNSPLTLLNSVIAAGSSPPPPPFNSGAFQPQLSLLTSSFFFTSSFQLKSRCSFFLICFKKKSQFVFLKLSADLLPTFFKFIPTGEWVTIPLNQTAIQTPWLPPTLLPLPLVVTQTTVRLCGLTYFLCVKPSSNLRVCFVGMTLSTCMGGNACTVTFTSNVWWLWKGFQS